MFLCITAFVASVLGSLVQLINASVFLLAFVYFATCVSSLWMKMSARGERLIGYAVPMMGALFSVVLMFLVSFEQILISIGLIALGIPIYVFFSPKKELAELRTRFYSREAVLRRAYYQGENFLAYPWRRLMWRIYVARNKTRPWVVNHESEKDH